GPFFVCCCKNGRGVFSHRRGRGGRRGRKGRSTKSEVQRSVNHERCLHRWGVIGHAAFTSSLVLCIFSPLRPPCPLRFNNSLIPSSPQASGQNWGVFRPDVAEFLLIRICLSITIARGLRRLPNAAWKAAPQDTPTNVASFHAGGSPCRASVIAS